MEKTISITLNNQNFIIEEDAYNKLAEYLENIKQHFGAGADSVEVIADIENSMAEKLKSSLSSYKEVINIEDVDSLIKIMGTTEDFDREIGGDHSEKINSEEDPSDPKIPRKLYRDTDNAIVAGVAAGLGNYFDIDPVLIRVIFFALMFAGGSGVLIYILLWIAMPEAKTAYQKMEMKGQAPTLAAFKELAKTGKKIQANLKKNSSIEKIFNLPIIIIKGLFSVLSKVWKKVWPIIKYVFGLGLAIFSFIFLGAIGIGSLFMLLYNNSAYELYFIPISEITNLMPYTWLVITGFLSLAIPATVALIGGLSILFRKNIFNFTISLIIILVWMASGIFFCANVLRYFPEVQNKFNNNPLVRQEEKNIDLKNIKEIEVSGEHLNVFITKSTSTPATLNGRQIDLSLVKIEKQNEKLLITETENKSNKICFNCGTNYIELKMASSSNIKINAINGASVNNENILPEEEEITDEQENKIIETESQ